MNTAQGSPLILEHVGIQFGSQPVLHDLDLCVERGQTLVVIGESGCGKTVLLKLLIGLLRPTCGRVVFDGRVLAELSDRELTRQRLRFGFLFQGSALFDSLTVFDNVAFGLRALCERKRGQVSFRHKVIEKFRSSKAKTNLTPFSETEIRKQVQRRLQEVGMTPDVELLKPAELSGGMKKRVGLARALALDPEIMLYDEPTTGLDPIMTDVISELILQVSRRQPLTSIVVTHDMKTAQKVADRIVMLYPLARLQPGEKQILFDGTPAELQQCLDTRVRQFVEGEAGERLNELMRTNT